MSAEPIHLPCDGARMCGSASLSLSDDVEDVTCMECLLALQKQISDAMIDVMRGGFLRLDAVAARIAEVRK